MGDVASARERPAGLGPTEVVTFIAGVVLLVASFLPLLELDLGGDDGADAGFGALLGGFIDTEWTAWSDAFSIFPLVTLPVLCLLVLIGLRALGRFTTVTVPARLAGLPLPTAQLLVAAFALVAVLAQIVRTIIDSGSDEEGSLGAGAGAWLALLALAALVGTAVAETRAVPLAPGDRRRPDQRAAATTTAGTVIVAIASFLEVWSSEGDEGVTAWGEGARPVYLLPLVMALLTTAATALDLRSERGAALLGVDLGRWRIVLAALTLFAAIALLIGNPVFGGFDSFVDTGVGVYVSIVGAAAVLAGALIGPAAASAPLAPEAPSSPAPPYRPDA